MVQFELNATTLPAIKGGGAGGKIKETTEVVAYPDKSTLKYTDVIKPKDISGLDPAAATPYLKMKTLQLTLEIESEEEFLRDSIGTIDDLHSELLTMPAAMDKLLKGLMIDKNTRKKLTEMAAKYSQLVAVQSSRKSAAANKKRLREIKNEALLDAGKMGIDLSSDELLKTIRETGTKKLEWKK